MSVYNRFTDRFNNLGNNNISPQETILVMVSQYTEISTNVNKSTSQKPYLEYFKMHQEFMKFMNSTIDKIDSPQAKSACLNVKISIIKIHDSIQKEYHRKNNFIQELASRFC